MNLNNSFQTTPVIADLKPVYVLDVLLRDGHCSEDGEINSTTHFTFLSY